MVKPLRRPSAAAANRQIDASGFVQMRVGIVLIRLNQLKSPGVVGGRVQSANRKHLYIDGADPSQGTLRILVWQALKRYSRSALLELLSDEDVIVRTIACRELQVRGGPGVFKHCQSLCQSPDVGKRVIGLFILGQLGTPTLPFRDKTLDLIESILSRERSPAVIAQALFAVGHLRKGRPLRHIHEGLYSTIAGKRPTRGFEVKAARAFALRR